MSSSKVWLQRFYWTVRGPPRSRGDVGLAYSAFLARLACAMHACGRGQQREATRGGSRTLALPEEFVVGRERDHGRHGGGVGTARNGGGHEAGLPIKDLSRRLSADPAKRSRYDMSSDEAWDDARPAPPARDAPSASALSPGPPFPAHAPASIGPPVLSYIDFALPVRHCHALLLLSPRRAALNGRRCSDLFSSSDATCAAALSPCPRNHPAPLASSVMPVQTPARGAGPGHSE